MKNFPKSILISLVLALALSACEIRVDPAPKPSYSHEVVYYDYYDTDDCFYEEDIYQQYGYYYYCETTYCYDYQWGEYYIWDEDCWPVQ